MGTQRAQFGGRQIVGTDFGIDADLAHPARDQLGVLGPKIQNQDAGGMQVFYSIDRGDGDVTFSACTLDDWRDHVASGRAVLVRDANPYVVTGAVSISAQALVWQALVWQATPQLRWLNGVLQQYWVGHNYVRHETEWRDVPVVEEADAAP